MRLYLEFTNLNLTQKLDRNSYFSFWQALYVKTPVPPYKLPGGNKWWSKFGWLFANRPVAKWNYKKSSNTVLAQWALCQWFVEWRSIQSNRNISIIIFIILPNCCDFYRTNPPRDHKFGNMAIFRSGTLYSLCSPGN